MAALHGQSIFNGGGMAPLNKLGKQPIAPGAQKKNVTRNKLDKTVTPQETAKITEDNAKKALDVNEKAVLLKQKSARELGELATDINVIARNAHMETNLEMEIVPQGLRVLIKDDQNRNMFERGSAKIMPFFKSLLVELTPVFDSLDNKLIITGHTDAMSYKSNIYTTGTSPATVLCQHDACWKMPACRRIKSCRLAPWRTKCCWMRKTRKAQATAVLRSWC